MPPFSEQLHLTVFGQMMVVHVVYKRGQQIRADMASADDAVRPMGLYSLGRQEVPVAFAAQDRCYGLFNPQTLRPKMQHVVLILTDHVIFGKIDTFGIDRFRLHWQTVDVVSLGTSASALGLGYGLSTTLFRTHLFGYPLQNNIQACPDVSGQA